MCAQGYLAKYLCEVSDFLLFFPRLVQLGAGGFLVAVAGFALVAVFCCLFLLGLCMRLLRNGPA